MTPEEKASQSVRLRATHWGIKLFRNNNGVLKNPIGIPIRFGLGNESKTLNKNFKSSDFIGIYPVQITQEMVGKTIGVFTSIEVKRDGFKLKENYNKNSREFAQNKWINMIKSHGGLAGFSTNCSNFDKIIRDFIRKLTQ